MLTGDAGLGGELAVVLLYTSCSVVPPPFPPFVINPWELVIGSFLSVQQIRKSREICVCTSVWTCILSEICARNCLYSCYFFLPGCHERFMSKRACVSILPVFLSLCLRIKLFG